MDQTSREIEQHIDRTRDRLGSHLVELEQKVEAATDWREHFRARPGVFLGAAFIGGASIALALHASSARPVSEDDASARADGLRHVVHDPNSAQAQVLELWSNFKTALIALAGARAIDYLSELVPGFDEHYRRAEQRTIGV